MQVQRPLHLGKCPGRSPAVTGVIGPVLSRLFYVSDVHTHTSFLIDTGSEVSAIPPSVSDRQSSPDALTLSAVNNTPIRTYGKQSLTLNLGSDDHYRGFLSLPMFLSPSLVLTF